MVYRFLADVVVVVHLLFIFFVIAGGVLVLHRRSVAWVHVPCVVWAILIEVIGWRCPLTPAENWLRQMGMEAGYEGGFIEHHILPVVYPTELTPGIQMLLGTCVLLVNLCVYGFVVASSGSSARSPGPRK